MAYQQPSVEYADPRTQAADNDQFEPPGNRNREASTARRASIMPEQSRYAPPQRPIDEAVTKAFDRAGAETSNYVPPELIAQITQNVIKQLQTGGGLDGSTPVPSHNAFSPPPPSMHQPVPLSPSTTSGTSPNMTTRVYTPPSPMKHSDYPSHTPPQSQSGYSPDDLPSPRHDKPAHLNPRRSSSPHSQTSESSDKPHVRPKGPARLSTSKEETTLEKIWGQLFDEDGHPTKRLGQFLRGLAVHIIEDYEPRHSIVITPTKMVKYYDDVKLSDELYPWPTVFDDEHSSISRMYRDLECQHHLVQERYDERPDIPGLTPVGFERWATLLIQAHPEEEFGRLRKAVLDMPICNPDDRKERFPKELSRRLFPGHEDRRTREKLEDSISEHAAIEIPRRRSREEPPPPRYDSPTHKPGVAERDYAPQSHRSSVSFDLPSTSSAAPSTYMPSQLERERKPYSNVPSESAIDDTNPPMPPPPSNPIERARQPYSVLPGGGKQFEDEARSTKPRPESFVGSAPKPSRSDSSARSRPIPVNNPRPMEVPKPTEVHHHRAPSNAGRRHRSPSFSRGSTNDFRRSDGDIRGYQPSSYQVPASLPVGAPPVEAVIDENDTRRYFEKNARERAERVRRQAEEDARGYGESPRRYDRAGPPPRRDEYLNDEDYNRASGRQGSGHDYGQPYGGPVYR